MSILYVERHEWNEEKEESELAGYTIMGECETWGVDAINESEEAFVAWQEDWRDYIEDEGYDTDTAKIFTGSRLDFMNFFKGKDIIYLTGGLGFILSEKGRLTYRGQGFLMEEAKKKI